jgi:hypothetical protein
MAARCVAIVVLVIMLAGCLEPPVSETLEVRLRRGGASVVSVVVALRDPEDYGQSPRVRQRLESEAREFAAGEQLTPGTGCPAAEEGHVVHEDARRGRHQPAGTRPHAVEGGRRHQSGPGFPGHGDAEQLREAPHLTFKVGGQVVGSAAGHVFVI